MNTCHSSPGLDEANVLLSFIADSGRDTVAMNHTMASGKTLSIVILLLVVVVISIGEAYVCVKGGGEDNRNLLRELNF